MRAGALDRRAGPLTALALLAVVFVVLRVAVWLDLGGTGFEAFVLWRAGTGCMVVATVLLLARALVPGERVAWLFVGLGAGCWTAGDAVWDLVWSPAGIEPPAPNLADALYLSFYGLASVGVVLLLRERLRPFRASLLLEGLIAGLTLAAVSAALGLGVVLDAIGGDRAAAVVALAYPLADELLLCLVGLTFALTGWRLGASWAMLSLGFAATSVADSLYAYSVARGTWDEASLLGAVWPLSVLTLAAAAWLPARHGRPRAVGPRIVTLPSSFALVAIGVLFYGQLEPVTPVAGGLAALALLAGVARARLAIDENVELLRRFRDEALTDVLTGIGNRRRLMHDLEARVSEPGPLRGSLLLFDLDGFKLYNDALGHAAGDALLARLAAGLARAVDGEGRAYRLGGDEFCVLVDRAIDPDEPLVARSCAALCERADGVAVTASFGLVVVPDEAASPSAALQLADERMYARKASRGTGRHGGCALDPGLGSPAPPRALARPGPHRG